MSSRARRLEPDQRREQILDRAVELFGERPYSAVSTTELAEAAGVTRGLLHHYFGTKRGLYLAVVRRMVLLPDLSGAVVAKGPMRARVERSVDWFLDTVERHGRTFVAVTGAEGVGDDPEIEGILAHADDVAARRVLELLGVGAPETDDAADADGMDARKRAMIRAYGGLVKGAVREWVRKDALTRDEVRLLLVHALLAIVVQVLPELSPPRPAAARRR